MALSGALSPFELSSPVSAPSSAAGARPRPDAIPAEHLPDAVLSGAVVVDIRTQAERDAQGTLPGALAIAPALAGRRLDPRSPERLSLAADPAVRWVLVSSDGRLASGLVMQLRSRGLPGVVAVTDGFRGLRRARMVGAISQAEHLRREAETISAH